MRLLPAALAAIVVVATLAAPGHAQQRLKRLLEQRREAGPVAPLPAGTRVERDIAYGPHPKQRFDVYLPAQVKAGAPILFMVHGGGWRIGDKDSRGVTGNKAAHWLQKGFVFVRPTTACCRMPIPCSRRVTWPPRWRRCRHGPRNGARIRNGWC